MSRYHALRSLALVLVSALALLPVRAQDRLPLDALPLTDLSAFQPVAANWQIAGGVTTDRHAERDLSATPGTGVLANVPTEDARDNLFTTWEHGDLELELEFLVPQGSNSGIYLMGRYEVQILDSWGVEHPRYQDAGAIYQRWDPSRGSGREGYEGHPPRQNASRAPGLWQRYHIVFQAPRFDANGNKIANARFVRVVHNGLVVQENVEVTGPTRAAAFEDEQPLAPLMIQGDHGPVAFRNIRYRRYTDERVQLGDLTYRYYEGEFESLDDLGTPLTEASTPTLNSMLAQSDREFALAFDGTLTAPADGPYRFRLDTRYGNAMQRLRIAGTELDTDQGSAIIELPAGDHPFHLTIGRGGGWGRPVMMLEVEGPGMPPQALHDGAALPQPDYGQIFLEPVDEPIVQRGFVQHGATKRAHAAVVGTPAGAHYAVDLDQGGLLHAWRGSFAEMTEMWHSRGETQLAEPNGSVLRLDGGPPVAQLASTGAPWPALGETPMQFDGYTFEDEIAPTFHYTLPYEDGTITVRDHLAPTDAGPALQRTLHLSADGRTPRNLYVRLAVGSTIEPLTNTTYLIDERQYYIELHTPGLQPMVRPAGDRTELVVPVVLDAPDTAVAYTLVW